MAETLELFEYILFDYKSSRKITHCYLIYRYQL